MISVKDKGPYWLFETKGHVKILVLDTRTYAWVVAPKIGEILVRSHSTHMSDCVLAVGAYRLYEVRDEAGMSDQQHLELNVGNGLWQGYLLPTGLPTDDKVRMRLIPTTEVISHYGVPAGRGAVAH